MNVEHYFNLNGKIALITGASHGIGMSIATGIADAGARVVINGRSRDRLDQAIQAYRERGVSVHAYVFDVTNETEVRQSLEQIRSEVGPIDILVNNAAIIERTPLVDMEVSAFTEILQVDLVGPFIMAKNLVPDMIARGGGKIINICSMMSELSRNTVGAYAAAKGGLKMLTKVMADEWAKFNIQANAIGPGYIATDQTKPLRTPGNPFYDFIIKRTPARRWGNPEELRGAAIFLASAASDFVNGHVLYVDGGILAFRTTGLHFRMLPEDYS